MSEFWRKQQVPTFTTAGTGLAMSIAADTNMRACNCIGPRNGQPRCPCMMVGIVERDGRWIQLERDLGPVRPEMLDRSAIQNLMSAWPAGCPKQRSCSRNRGCMYGCKAHAARPGDVLKREIEAALAEATPKSNPRGQ